MRVLKLLAATLAIAGSAAPAVAAGADPAPYSWTGFHAGVSIGIGVGLTRMDDNFPAPVSNPFRIGGWAAAGSFGYDQQLGRHVVVGFEGDLSYSGIAGQFGPGLLGPVWNCGSGPCYTDIAWLATARGRLGLSFGRVLVYGTGGIGVARIASGIGVNPLYTGVWTERGWTAGGGFAFGTEAGWTFSAEGVYVDLGWTPPVGANDFQASAHFTVVRFGIVRSFR